MGNDPIHLVKIPFRLKHLPAIAKRRGIRGRDLDEGYLTHCLLRELWQDLAPQPFVVRSERDVASVWGYARADGPRLTEHVRAFGDPELVRVLVGIDAISSRPMPVFAKGRRVGFVLRACPVVRLASERGGHRAGAEIDAFLARSLAVGPEVSVDREAVYREWFETRLGPVEESGVRLEGVAVMKHLRERFVRRTHGGEREARRIERPDVELGGDLVVEDGELFLQRVAKGVGRHRAFGFGALLVVPPGSHAGGG